MRDESVARRYAAALFAQVQRQGALDTVRRELSDVATSLRTVAPLRSFLYQPLLTEERKKSALRAVFEGKISETLLTFLQLMIDKRRIEMLPKVAAEFERLALEFNNKAIAVATSAVPLSQRETRDLVSSLEARTGKNIELQTNVDPSLIGGVFVRIGDTVYDGSVRGQLERLREHLLKR